MESGKWDPFFAELRDLDDEICDLRIHFGHCSGVELGEWTLSDCQIGENDIFFGVQHVS